MFCCTFQKHNLGGKAVLAVYGLSGNKVQEEKVTVFEGTSDFQINLTRAIPGIYIVKIQGANFESDPVKIIKY
ncbi:T9SS type A sorting domain-containing protein [Antarcticibacterium sp. 1MA-6-2]|uniref:T9SS type A sorting domain-containing protein n=1 Tax=Antarcticibacterium sp. 1MA-6-2 TaxID=2908210 RepID=UPI0038FC985E